MSKRYKTDPETANAWVVFFLSLLLAALIGPFVPDKGGLGFWVWFIIWITLNLLFGLFNNYSEKKRANSNLTNKNNKTKQSVIDNGSILPTSRKKDNYNGYDKEKLFNDYINKEMEKIIKDNNISDYKDKQAAKIIAVNNAKNSSDIISNIWNLPMKDAKEVQESISIQEERKIANHTAYEGRISTTDKNKLKNKLGYKCEACGADMYSIYGDIGQNYIELHHKIPYSHMKENETRILTDKEFCVLCPNCHRMIHKLPDAGDIDLLTRIIKINKKS